MIVTVSRLMYDAVIGILNAEGSLRTFPYVQFLTELRTLRFSVEVLRNELSVNDYIQFLESRYDDSYDSWFENEVICNHIITLKYTGILPSLDERQNTVLDIVLTAIKNMEKLTYNPKRIYLYAEARHIIHLPEMLNENSGLVEYYLYIDRETYICDAHKKNRSKFDKLWKRMEKSMGDALMCINYTMAMFEDSFEKVKNGLKTFEIRINDEKRKNIKIGDTITFYNLSDVEQTVTVQVISRRRFDTFRQAFMSRQNMRVFGGEVTDVPETMLRNIYRIYSKKEEIKYGIIVFEIELMEE